MSDTIKILEANKNRGHAIFAPNATKLAARSVLEQVTRHSPSFKPLETKEHVLEAGSYVDVCHSINDTRFVVGVVDGELIHGTMHKKHFEGSEITVFDVRMDEVK